MVHAGEAESLVLRPGTVCVPGQVRCLGAIATSGVVVAIHDRLRGRGGMVQYLLPRREGRASTPLFAAPAIVGLTRLLEEDGSARADLVAHLYGAASNPGSPRFVAGLAEENAAVAREILEHLRLGPGGSDLGGDWARKVVFDPESGETVVARVRQVRASDWYPEVDA